MGGRRDLVERGGPQLLSVDEVAGLMRVSRASVYRLIRTGRLSPIRIGRVVRVSERAVDEHLRQTLPPELA
jgi:excisionase family DNA binding protein